MVAITPSVPAVAGLCTRVRHPRKGREMPSARPSQRPHARVSACIAALVKHRILECGLVDHHIDMVVSEDS